MSLNQLLRMKKVPLNIRFAITTDSEIAMINGAKATMINIIHSLCHRHLRQNVKRNLKPGMKEEEVEVLELMFDKDDALVTIDDEAEFVEAKSKIDTRVFKNAQYFEVMCTKIWESVIIPRKEANGALKVKNTTNHVECTHHVIKKEAKWELKQLDAFVVSKTVI